jgi:XapX domain-containing protein
MKLLIGLLISFAVGAGCRIFDIPVGSPPVVPGALLVLAMTLGYSSTNTILNRRDRPATTAHLCGGSTGATVEQARLVASPDRRLTSEDQTRLRLDSGGSK